MNTLKNILKSKYFDSQEELETVMQYLVEVIDKSPQQELTQSDLDLISNALDFYISINHTHTDTNFELKDDIKIDEKSQAYTDHIAKLEFLNRQTTHENHDESQDLESLKIENEVKTAEEINSILSKLHSIN